MFTFIKNGFSIIKDYGIEILFKEYINRQIKEFGKMLNLKIDPKDKNIELDILLKGEKESIKVTIEKYNVEVKNNTTQIKFDKVIASREWINVLIKDLVIPNYAPNKTIEIESSYGKIIDLLT